jgi:hypothetical protein
MENNKGENMERNELVEASLMALGALVAKSSVSDPVVVILARALKNSGTESSYVLDIVERADQLKP